MKKVHRLLRPKKELWGPEAVTLSECVRKKGQAIISVRRVKFHVDV